jgi:hypothetical protein
LIIEALETFSYFSRYVDVSGKILDFGSNSGNLIRSSYGKIPQENYTGIDVLKVAIDEGKRLYPNANWILYNRSHPIYNPFGVDSIPYLGLFDRILSYSVFSHFDLEETLYSIDRLYSMLASNGKLAFSYCSIYNSAGIEWFRARRENCDIIPMQDCVYLVNNRIETICPPIADKFVSFFKPEYLTSILTKKGYNTTTIPAHGAWMQDCIIIQKI